MLQIKDNQITMTCGDTVQIQITIFTQNADIDNLNIPIGEQIYTLSSTDKLHFIVLDINNEGLSNRPFNNIYNAYINKSLNKPPILDKEFDSNIITLNRNDTLWINPGMYLYGCVLIQEDGSVNTIQSGDLILTQSFY